MSEQLPVIEPAPVGAEKEKTVCSCGKSISKKNMSVHLKTDAHQKSVVIPIQSNSSPVGVAVSAPVSPAEPKANSSELKLKKRFDDIDEKLDHILDIVDELACEILGAEDDTGAQ